MSSRKDYYIVLNPKDFDSEEDVKNFLKYIGITNPEAVYTARFKYPVRDLKLPGSIISTAVDQAIKEYGNKIILLFSPDEIQLYPYPRSVKVLFPNEWQIAEYLARVRYNVAEGEQSPKLVAIMHPYNPITREFIVDFFEIDEGQAYLNRFLYELKEKKKDNTGKFYVIARRKLIAEI